MALIGSLTSGVSALQTFSKSIETIGDNIANANTTGFKFSRTRNQDSFSQTLNNATTTSSMMQVGSGVDVATNRQNFNQGSLSSTGISTDLGIAGNGFFKVTTADGLKSFYTRDGNFHLDASSNVVDSQGNRLQGDATGGTAGATPIKLTNLSTNPLTSFSIAGDGQISENYADGTSALTQRVTLWNFADPTSLKRSGGNLFSATPAAGISATASIPGTDAGLLKQGALEQSNVDLAQEFSELITAQRSFQAGSRIISVSDSVLEEIVNLKR